MVLGTDDVVIRGSPPLQALPIDMHDTLGEYGRERAMVSVKGVETANFTACRRVSVSVEALQHNDMLGESDEVVEHLVDCGPDMFMSIAEEETGRARTLENAVDTAVSPSLPQENMGQLESVLWRQSNAFRRVLRGDPARRVEPLHVTLKAGARAVKAYARTYSPISRSWIVACMGTLAASKLVFLNS